MAGKNHQFLNGWLFAAAAIMVMVAVVCSRAPIRGSSDDALIGQPTSPIRISADWSQEWSEDQGTIALFRGRCQIVQGSGRISRRTPQAKLTG